MKLYRVSQYIPGFPGPVVTRIKANKFNMDNVYGIVTFIKDDEPVLVLHMTDSFTIEKLEESQ